MNKNAKLVDIQVLAHNKYALRNVAFDLRKESGAWQRHHWEVYEHGNAVTVLLYNRKKKTIILVRQFRIVPYLAGETGMLLETCAGLLDNENPKEGMLREIEEETGYRMENLKQVYEAYTSSGALSEKLYFFVGEYHDDQKQSKGGGVDAELEDVEVIEMPFNDAIAMLRDGAIHDVKTILLLQHALLHNLLVG